MRLRRPAPLSALLLPFLVLGATTVALLTSATARADDGDEWLGPDKVLHCGISAGLAATFYTATTPLFDARYPPLLIGAAATLAIGAGKEAYDSVSGGDPSWRSTCGMLTSACEEIPTDRPSSIQNWLPR